MSPQKIAWTLLILSLYGSFFPAARADEITFWEAYELAIDYAPSLRIAKFNVDGAEARKDQALGKLFPQATIFGQWSKNRLAYEDGTLFSPDSDYPGERYGVSVRQSLLAVSDGLEVNRQDLLYQLSQDELRIAEADLLKELLTAYLDVLLSDAEVVLLKDELSSVQTKLDEAKALYSRNLLPVTQVLETESRRDTLAADLTMAEGKTAVTREILIKFTGLRGGEPLPVSERFSLLNRFSDPEATALIALKFAPAVSAAQISASAAERAVLREKSRWIPDIALNYNYQYSDIGFDNLRSPARDTSTLALDFRYPIFEGGARSARIRGASAEYSSALTGLRAQELETEVRARSAWLVFEAASERVISARQAVTSSEVSVTAAQKAVKAGTARYTDVLLALAQQSRSLRDLAYARFYYAGAWVELELSSGAAPRLLAQQLSDAMHGR